MDWINDAIVGGGLLALLAAGCVEDGERPSVPDADVTDATRPEVARELDPGQAAEPPRCPPGAVADDDGVCVDLDECALGLDDCAPEATCRNTDGGWGCACPQGMVGDGRRCVLRIDCSDGAARCDAHAECAEVAGEGHFCRCAPGFVGDGRDCRDVDECASGRHLCPAGSGCLNTVGSYRCELR